MLAGAGNHEQRCPSEAASLLMLVADSQAFCISASIERRGRGRSKKSSDARLRASLATSCLAAMSRGVDVGKVDLAEVVVESEIFPTILHCLKDVDEQPGPALTVGFSFPLQIVAL